MKSNSIHKFEMQCNRNFHSEHGKSFPHPSPRLTTFVGLL
jgi:hypothetical protein